jgi:hypothetical protein
MPMVEQRRTAPAVYLDTCALRLFAEDKTHGDNFRDMLKARQGTLVLSALSFAEFAKFEDPRHARIVGHYIDSLGSQFFFSHFAPFFVVNRETELWQAKDPQAPDGDIELLQQLMKPLAFSQGPLSVGAVFNSVATHRQRLNNRIRSMSAGTLKGIRELRERMDREPEFRKNMLASVKDANRPRATLALARALVAGMYADRRHPPSENDAVDMLQTAVPGSYCHYLVLDGGWHAKLMQATKRLRAAGIVAPVAQSFSLRRNGIARFLDAFCATQASELLRSSSARPNAAQTA